MGASAGVHARVHGAQCEHSGAHVRPPVHPCRPAPPPPVGQSNHGGPRCEHPCTKTMGHPQTCSRTQHSMRTFHWKYPTADRQLFSPSPCIVHNLFLASWCGSAPAHSPQPSGSLKCGARSHPGTLPTPCTVHPVTSFLPVLALHPSPLFVPMSSRG